VATDQREAATRRARPQRPPPWRDIRVIRVVLQIAFLIAVVLVAWSLANNLVTNLRGRGIRTDFGFLSQPAGFAISGTDFSSRDPVWRAIAVGVGNTIRVAAAGIVLATVLGVVIGVARLSTNWLVRKCAAAFVEALRNVPLLVFLFFLYIAVLQRLPRMQDAIEPPGFVLSNRGVWVPWLDRQEGAGGLLVGMAAAALVGVVVAVWRTRLFNRTGRPHRRVLWGGGTFAVVSLVGWAGMGRPLAPTVPVRTERIVEGGYQMSIEMGALLVGLVLYMAAFIAEIVRGSIQAVPKGQTEAANALGLSGFQRLRYVILPQAMRVAIPPTGNEFLNLTKNSALGLAIAFPEALRVTRIAIGNGMPAPQLIGIVLGIYLTLSLILSVLTNLANWAVTRKGRR
jgi:general L-amino acid transport system permease protein